MRKIFAAIAFAAILAFPLGCIHKPQPLPAGAINQVDAGINSVLQSGHAAVVQYQSDVANGFKPTPLFAQTVLGLTRALNYADPLYQAYHETLKSNPGAPEPPALATAVSQVQISLQAVQQQGGKK